MAGNPFDETARLANLLAAQAKLKFDYSAFLKKERKLILVEGSTDKEFISNVKSESVDCIVASSVFNGNASFRTSATESVNCKKAIVQIIQGISRYPSFIIQKPNDIDKWDLYGMVDLDCDELGAGVPTERLFVTDTHDLETLMLKTDDILLDKLEGCEISHDDVKKAYFVAYQLSQLRDILKDIHDRNAFNLGIISCGSRQVEFNSFLHETKVCFPDLVKYIAEKSGNVYSSEKKKQIIDRVLKSKEGKRKFDAEGLWKQEISSFDISSIPNFWTSINGHDVLQLIQYFNADVCAKYCSSTASLNRNFEMSLIKVYDYSCLSKTDLYKKMKAAGIVN